jgi:C1A family cysteine protease
VFTENASQQKFLWEQFKQEYRKTYDANEEPKRFQIFLENLKVVDERNKLDNVHGITKFSDLSQEEFEAHYLGSKPSSKKVNDSLRSTVDHIPSTVGDSTVSWVGKYTTPVKNQGYCGSCWAFSATEQLESDSMRLLGTDYILSPEQVTQCTTGAFGCGGGWTETAYTYIKNAGGLEQDTDYPYTSYFGQTGTCHADSSLEVVTLTGFTTITGSSTSAIETNMANYMLATGPLSVCLDASSWNSYTGGIMKVCGNNVDHCVQAVGVTTGSSGYWNVRNSWGTSWGNAGYIYLAYGANTCDITNDPTYVAAVKSSR